MQGEQELFSHHFVLDVNKVDVPVCSAGDIFLSDEGEVPVSSVVFAQALSGNQWRLDASAGCGLSLPRLL